MILRVARKAYAPEPHDLWSFALYTAFAVLSVIWPRTGVVAGLPRGYLVAPLLLISGLVALLLGLFDFSRAPKLVRFLRCYYPQAFFAPLFEESIRLSSQCLGGRPHDALFEGLDGSVFGCQPARELSAAIGRATGHAAWANELMFAAYFSFYFLLVLTPWIAWMRGDEEEAERESSAIAFFMLIFYIVYAFFRVVGPKHWLPDLVAAGYSLLPGGFFASLQGSILAAALTDGAAFPSSHVAFSLMMTVFVARNERRLLPLYILDCLLIALATVYLYAHWVADVAAGALALALLLPLHDRILKRLRSISP
jgi:membrane-associated phospholipid phosphatase